MKKLIKNPKREGKMQIRMKLKEAMNWQGSRNKEIRKISLKRIELKLLYSYII